MSAPLRALTLPRLLLAAGLVATSFGLLVATGVVGVGRGAGYWDSGVDMRFWYTAGVTLRRGLNPYHLEEFVATARTLPGVSPEYLRESGFAYPPQVALPSLALSTLSMPAALVAMTLANLLGVLAICYMCMLLAAAPDEAAAPSPPGTAGALALWTFTLVVVMGSPFTQHTLWLGQSTILVTAALLAGWYCVRRDRHVLGGALLAIATFKIHLTVLALAWLLLEKRFKAVFAAAAVTLGMMAWPLWNAGGPLPLARDWVASLAAYRSGVYNVVGFRHVFSLQSLLAAAGFPTPSLAPLAGLSLIGLWLYRRRMGDLAILGALSAASSLFLYAKDHDLVFLTPLFVALWIGLRGDRVATTLFVASLVILFFPQRLLRGVTTSPVILHWRELVVLAQVAVLLLAARRPRAPASEAPAIE